MFNKAEQTQKIQAVDTNIVAEDIKKFKKDFGFDLEVLTIEDYALTNSMVNSVVRRRMNSSAAVESGQEIHPFTRAEVVEEMKKLNYVAIARLTTGNFKAYVPMINAVNTRIKTPLVNFFNKIINGAVSKDHRAINSIEHFRSGRFIQLGTLEMSNDMLTRVYTIAGKAIGMVAQPKKEVNENGDTLNY